MDYKSAALRLKEQKIEYGENVVLAQYTTFRIGGAAKLAVFPKNISEACAVLKLMRDEGIRVLVIGNGSNLLVSDNGFDGAAVILSGMRNVSFDGCTIRADAGVPLTRLALEASKRSLTGLEFAYGIPGSVGGAVYMNAGAYGGEMSQVIVSSTYYDPESRDICELSSSNHDFRYRHSSYMENGRIILSAEFRLEDGDKDVITAKMNELMSRRRDKQPLEYPSAGSVFKRGNGFITAQAIDEAGLKGRRVGGAEVSQKHAGFIVNLGGATAGDVLSLIKIIKAEVLEKFGYEIECEIRYIGG